MSNKDYALTMARYNCWQNQSLLAAASTLSASERELDRGAFFGSIQKTFSHLFWGDTIWFSRFTGAEAPAGGIAESVAMIQSWQDFRMERPDLDERILRWVHEIEPNWFEGDLSWYSGAVEREVVKPKRTLIIHFFNHQTHHRGQIHSMLTAAGAKPEATDLPFMPDRFLAL